MVAQTKVPSEKRAPMRRLLKRLTAGRDVKSQLAQAYYEYGVAGLIGCAEGFGLHSQKLMWFLIAMIEELPRPDYWTIRWLSGQRFFTEVGPVANKFTLLWHQPALVAQLIRVKTID